MPLAFKEVNTAGTEARHQYPVGVLGPATLPAIPHLVTCFEAH
jgi:hypothetical protein